MLRRQSFETKSSSSRNWTRSVRVAVLPGLWLTGCFAGEDARTQAWMFGGDTKRLENDADW